MHPFRVRFAGDILCEFLPPKRPSNQVIVVAPGMPSMPNTSTLLNFLHKKNYWGFFIRYRGTWESDGQFLKQEPTQDILDIVNELQKPFIDIWTKQQWHIPNPQIHVAGISFGGPAALLASRDSRIHRIISIAGVTDWRAGSKEEPLPLLETLTREAFGQGYRFDHKDWMKLEQGSYYNPMTQAEKIDGKKILCIHAKDDRIVPVQTTQTFIHTCNTASYLLRRGGHLSKRSIMRWRIWRQIQRFIHS